MATEERRPEQEDIHSEDFQFVLKELLSAYQPILEEDLKRAKAPEQLKREAESKPASCEDEIALADRIFEKFVTPDVAQRLLPAEARELLGPIDRWRWCLLHIRCCIIFGWLVCRGPRTFRAFAYYLYRYWLCVRQVLGTPVATPPTPEQRQDFQTLVKALAGAFKPYLTDQLASVEFPAGIPDEVLAGKIDCHEGEEDTAAIFERLLTVETAQALLGKDAFAAHVKEPWFWFCRCWCLCAIRFGCCLARARTFVDLLRCLRFYRICLRECFQPLRCELTAPTGCVAEEINAAVGGVTVTVVGTATGGFFDHYTLEWRKVEGRACDDDTDFKSDGVVYPGGGPTGSVPVVGGVLGFIDTTALSAGSYEVRLCVYASVPGTARCCFCIQFDLFKRLVWIDRVAIAPGAPVQTPPGPFVSTAPIVNTNPGGIVVPVGGGVTIVGSAFVGDCEQRRIKCFDLRYGLDCLPGPDDVGFNPAAFFGSALALGPVCYEPPDENLKRASWNTVIERALTTQLVKTLVTINGFTLTVYKLSDYAFNSLTLPPCADDHHHCSSGMFTLLLDVTDTLTNHYYDTQCVLFDNKPIHAEIGGLRGLARCADLKLAGFALPGGSCAAPWPMALLGIAYDESIDYNDPGFNLYPNNNFDFYSLTITRQGGPTYSVPITPTLSPPLLGPDPLKGTQRVGDPGTRCEESIPACAVPPHPMKFDDVLTQIDLRIFDAVCAAALPPPFAPPPGFALNRADPEHGTPGECCGYAIQLYAQDKTWSNGYAGGFHHILTPAWAICICNDLPPSRG